MVSCLKHNLVGYGVLVVEFHLPRPVVHQHRAVLVVVFCGQRLVDIRGAVLVDVALVHLPFVEVDGEVEIMLVGEVVAVVEFAVVHVHVRASRRAAQHDVAVLRCAYRTIVIRRCASVLVSADHCHSAQCELVLVGCAEG